MNRNKFTAFVAGTALAALTIGCSTAPTANTTSPNSNTAVVLNSNQAPITGTGNTTGTNTSVNTNTRAGAYNANYGSEEDFARSRDEYIREAKEAGSSIGSGIKDAWIHTKVRAALAAADDLRDSTINVDVDNNVVTLRGSVASPQQKSKAASVAKSIDGVKNVTNNLNVSAGGGGTTGNSNARGNSNVRG